MADILLSFTCSPADAAEVAAAIHADGGPIVHMRDETVFGRDFSDATAAERVTGQLKRQSVELIVDDAQAEAIIDLVRNFKRSSPVRWLKTPVISSGRLS